MQRSNDTLCGYRVSVATWSQDPAAFIGTGGFLVGQALMWVPPQFRPRSNPSSGGNRRPLRHHPDVGTEAVRRA